MGEAVYRSLDVVVVNWNAGEQVEACVRSLWRSNQLVARLETVVVVDNASTDGSAETLEALGLPLTVLRNRENRGFGAACNQGAAAGRGEYLLFLNPDAEVFPDTLDRAVSYLAGHPDVGVVGVALRDETGHVARSSTRALEPKHVLRLATGVGHVAPRRFPTHFMAEWAHNETRSVDHVIGAFYLIRRSLFERLGGFDERFFVYLEDLDLSQRVREAGLDIRFLGDVFAFHKGGGASEKAKAARLFYSLRSRILYASKHFSRPQAVAAAVLTLGVEPFVRMAALAARRDGEGLRETLSGYQRLWGQASALIRGQVRREA